MSVEQITARLDKSILKALRLYCKQKGMVINSFIQQSIVEKLHELADIEEIPKLKKEPTRPFSEVLKELNLDG